MDSQQQRMNSYLNSFGKQTFPSIFDLSPTPTINPYYPVVPTDPYEVKNLLTHAEKDLSLKEDILTLNKNLLEMNGKILNYDKTFREDYPLLSEYHKENFFPGMSFNLKENVIRAEKDVNYAKAEVERLSKLLDGTPKLFSSSSEKKPKPSCDHAGKEILRNPIETVNSSKIDSQKRSLDSMNMTYLPFENRTFSRLPTFSRNIDLNNHYRFPPISNMDLNNTFNIPPIPQMDLNYPKEPTDPYSEVKTLLKNAEKDLSLKENTLAFRKIEVANAKDLLEIERKILNERKWLREDHPLLSNCNTEYHHKVLKNFWKDKVSSAERSLILKENALICAEEDVNCAKAKVEMRSKLLDDTAKLFSSSSEKKLKPSSDHAKKEILNSRKYNLNSMNMTYLPFDEQTFPPVPNIELNSPFGSLPIPTIDQNYPIVPIDPLSGRKLFYAEKDLVREEDALIRRKIDDDTKAIIEFNHKILNDEKRLRGDLPSSTEYQKVLENSLKENALIKAKIDVDEAKALVNMRSKLLDATEKWFSSSSKKMKQKQTGDKGKGLHLRYIFLMHFICFCLISVIRLISIDLIKK